MTRPLSRITSMTSASPLGRGRSMYPRGVVDTAMAFLPVACDRSRLVGLLRGQRFFRSVHQLLADERAVLGQSAGDSGLPIAVQVADRPVELLERVLGRFPVAVDVA